MKKIFFPLLTVLFFFSCTPMDRIPFYDMDFEQEEYTFNFGQSVNMTALLYTIPGRSLGNIVLQWQSSAPSIATVDAKGVLKTLGHGPVTITVTGYMDKDTPDEVNFTAECDVEIVPVVVTIKDTKFRDFCLDQAFNANGDDVLTSEEVCDVAVLNISDKQIADLSGIENFAKLTTLNCSNNTLKTMDLSKNTLLVDLDCSDNVLESLDVSKLTKLEKLDCSNNSDDKFTTLDVSNLPMLDELDCRGNAKLTELWVKIGTDLTEMQIYRDFVTVIKFK